VGSDTVHIALTVAAAPASSVTLAASPAVQTMQAGGTGSTTIDITRNNFPGSVQLAATGAPAGVTPTLTPTNTIQDSATLSVAVGTGAAQGGIAGRREHGVERGHDRLDIGHWRPRGRIDIADRAAAGSDHAVVVECFERARRPDRVA
jgi:hypothetical protein